MWGLVTTHHQTCFVVSVARILWRLHASRLVAVSLFPCCSWSCRVVAGASACGGGAFHPGALVACLCARRNIVRGGGRACAIRVRLGPSCPWVAVRFRSTAFPYHGGRPRPESCSDVTAAFTCLGACVGSGDAVESRDAHKVAFESPALELCHVHCGGCVVRRCRVSRRTALSGHSQVVHHRRRLL